MAKLIEITGKALAGEWGTDDETGKGIPVLRTTNFTNEGVVNYSDVVTRTITKKNIDEKFLRAGDIIIEKSGGSDKYPVGRVIYFDGPSNTYLFNNFTGLLRVQDQEKWFPKYVFYSLYGNYRRGGTRQFENKTTGLHNLKTDDYVSRYEVTETDYSKQKEICTQLDKLYSVIKMREDELEKLDELIKARFVEFFGDPVTNDKHWDMDTLLGVLEVGRTVTYGIVQTGDDVDEGIPVFRPIDIAGGHVPKREELKKTLPEISDKYKRTLLKGNELLITVRGSVGETFQVNEEFEGCNVGRNIVPLVTDKKRVNQRFLQELFAQKPIKDWLKAITKGIALQGLNMSEFKEMPVIIPDMVLQEEYVEFVEQVDKSKVAVQKALEETQTLFDSLMQEYFG